MQLSRTVKKIGGALFGFIVLGHLFAGARPAAADLPPRPTPVTKTISAPMVRGGFIELNIGGGETGQGTMVQWQTAGGEWIDVATWFGHAEPDGRKIWWVAPEHFATGPFRWQILDVDGNPQAASTPFTMPAAHGEVVVSTINLEN